MSNNVSIVPLSNNSLDSKQPYGGDAPNRAPVFSGPIPDVTSEVDQAVSRNMAQYFSDPDGDVLTFTADQLPTGLSMDTAGNITGTATVIQAMTTTITATDPGALFDTGTVEFDIIAAPTGESAYPVNYPNLMIAGAIGSWQNRFENLPWKNNFDYCYVAIRQGIFTHNPNDRANTANAMHAWRQRNPSGLLTDHENLRMVPASKPGASSDHLGVWNYVIKGGRMDTQLFHRYSNGVITPARVSQSTTLYRDWWDTTTQNVDFQRGMANDFWNRHADVGTLGGGEETSEIGPNSWIDVMPLMFHDNMPGTFSTQFRAAATLFSGLKTINQVVSQTKFRIDSANLDLSGGTDNEGYLNVDQSRGYSLYSWPNSKDNSHASAIIGIKKEVNPGVDEIKIKAAAQDWNISAGNQYLIGLVFSGHTDIDWNEPFNGTPSSDTTDPPERTQAIMDFMNKFQDVGNERYGFWCPPASNCVGGEYFDTEVLGRRMDYPNPYTGAWGLREHEHFSRNLKLEPSDDDQTYSANGTSSARRDDIFRNIEWGESQIDRVNQSIPISYLPIHGRGVEWEVSFRQRSGDIVAAANLLDELDAAYGRFIVMLALNNATTHVQFDLGGTKGTSATCEEQLFFPGDPETPGFPHFSRIASVTWNAVYSGKETVNYRTPDAGEAIYWTEYPDMLAVVNIRVPASGIWAPSHLPGGQSIDPVKDVFTPPDPGVGMAWYRYDSNTYFNTAFARNGLTGTGPNFPPWTDQGAVICKDPAFNNGEKITGPVSLGRYEGIALRRGPE